MPPHREEQEHRPPAAGAAGRRRGGVPLELPPLRDYQEEMLRCALRTDCLVFLDTGEGPAETGSHGGQERGDVFSLLCPTGEPMNP